MRPENGKGPRTHIAASPGLAVSEAKSLFYRAGYRRIVLISAPVAMAATIKPDSTSECATVFTARLIIMELVLELVRQRNFH